MTPTDAKNLDELLAALRSFAPETLADERALTRLPTFGGSEPADTAGIWSWDAHRLIVGTCAADYRIVGRTAYLGGAAKSEAKARASRANGAKGGRPRGA